MVQFIDSLSALSFEERVSRLLSRFCDPENVSRFELTESVLDVGLEIFVALRFPVVCEIAVLLDAEESAPVLDGLTFDILRPFFMFESTIRTKYVHTMGTSARTL